MNCKKARIDSINLISEDFESLFKSDEYFIETVKARGIFNPSGYKAEFGANIPKNYYEVKIIHTSKGLAIPLKRHINNKNLQIIEFAGLGGYLERSELLQELFNNIRNNLEEAFISRVDLCLDYKRVPAKAIKKICESRKVFKYKNTTYFKSEKEKKKNSYMDIKLYNHSLKNDLDPVIQRLEFCFKKSFIGEVHLKDLESIYPKMEKSISKATGLNIKVDSIL